MPTDDDILRARIKTIGVSEYIFPQDIQGVEWRLCGCFGLASSGRHLTDRCSFLCGLADDVGGARTQRHAWVPYFEKVDAIIFLAPLSRPLFSPLGYIASISDVLAPRSVRPGTSRGPKGQLPRGQSSSIQNAMQQQAARQGPACLVLEQVRPPSQEARGWRASEQIRYLVPEAEHIRGRFGMYVPSLFLPVYIPLTLSCPSARFHGQVRSHPPTVLTQEPTSVHACHLLRRPEDYQSHHLPCARHPPQRKPEGELTHVNTFPFRRSLINAATRSDRLPRSPAHNLLAFLPTTHAFPRIAPHSHH